MIIIIRTSLLLFLIALFSCCQKDGIHREKLASYKHEVNNSSKDSFSRKIKKYKGTSSFSKRKKRTISNFVFGSKKGDNDTYSYKLKKKNSGFNQYSSKERRVTTKRGIFVFLPKGKRDTESGSFRVRKKNKQSTNQFDIKKRTVICRSEKGKRERTSFDRTAKKTIGANTFNPKKKRVLPKKFLYIFKRYNHEKETSTFTGGKARKMLSSNIFNKKKRKVVQKKGLFWKKSEKTKKKKLAPELFDPHMRIRL